MAISVACDRTIINATGGDAESVTNWTETAAWSTPSVIDGDMYLQGSNCIGARASAAAGPVEACWWNHLTTGAANLNLTGFCIYFWIKCITLPSMNTRAKGGIGLSISSTAAVALDATAPWTTLPWRGITDSNQWFLTGSDFETTSGWVCYIVDPFSTPDFARNTPVMTSVDRIGIRADVLQIVGAGAFKPKNVLWDYIAYGSKLTITGSTGTFQDIFVLDSNGSNQYGMLRKSSGVFLGGGKLVFGTTGQTAVTVFTDTKQTLIWQDMRVDSAFYEIQLVGAGSFATTVTLGTYSGGLTSGGCTIKGIGLDTRRLIAPVIVSGGTTYVVGDILTVNGGTYTTQATFKVYAVSGGVITAIVMETAGVYSAPPTGTLSVTDARNSSATFTASVAGGSVWTLTASAANQTLNLYGCTFSEMLTAALASTTVVRGTTFDNFGDITANGALFDGCIFQNLRTTTPISAVYAVKVLTTTATITNCKFINCATALLWDRNADTNGKLDGTTFISGGTGHAIELGTNTPSSISLANVILTNYGGTPGSNPTSSSGSTDAAIYNNSGKAITITITGTGTVPAIRNGAGATTIVISGTVNVAATVKDSSGTAIQDAMVLVLAAAGGDLPFNVTVTISNSGTTATVTHTAHKMETNDKVQILGASLIQNNGVFSITKISADSYSYTMGSAPGSSPTGTIKATYVAISGLTNASGYKAIVAQRAFTSNQPVTGRVRKSTTGTLYKTSSIIDTINNVSGLSMTVIMIEDQ